MRLSRRITVSAAALLIAPLSAVGLPPSTAIAAKPARTNETAVNKATVNEAATNGSVAKEAAAADGLWRRLPTTGPRPSERSVPAVAGIGAALYVFGGARDDFATGVATFYDDLHRLDVHSGQWTVLQPSGARPAPRAFAASAATGGRMFVFGGSTFNVPGTEFQPFGDLWAYEPAANRWRPLAAATVGPGARSGATMWAVGDSLYLFGGLDATFTTHNDLWRFDLRSLVWSPVPLTTSQVPPPRHVAQAGQVAVAGQLTFYGGEAVDLSTGFAVLGDTWQFDLAQRRWRDVTPTQGGNNIAPPRNYGAAAVLGSALYLQGGDVPGGTGGCGAPFEQNPVAELWRFDLTQRTWRRLAPGGDPLVRLKRHAAAAVAGRMYLVSGWDFQCDPGPGQLWNLDVYVYSA